jgi:ABC-type glycerol-3-phosphate transport system substrate-binding protein
LDFEPVRSITRWIFVAGCCLELSLCLGCEDKPAVKTGPAALPFSGQAVGLAVPGGMGFRQAWDGPLIEWQAQTGAKIDLSEYDANSESEPATQFATDSNRTLMVFPLNRLGDLIDANALAPIPQATLNDAEGLNWLDVFAGLREGLASPRKRVSVVPLSCPVLVCYYRRDLLEQAGLVPPQTWDDYQRLLDRLGEWAPGLSAVEPWGADFRATMFAARSLAYAKHPGSYSVYFDIANGGPLIDGPGFVRGLEVAQRAWEKLAADFKDLTPAECRRRLLTGQAALAIAYEPEAGAANADGTAAADRQNEQVRIGFCRLPGSRETYDPARKAWEKQPDQAINHVTLVGFAGWGCAASSGRSAAEIEAAWNAVARMGGQGFVQGFPPGLTGPCRESQGPNSLDTTASGLRGDEAALCIAAIGQSLRDPRQVVEIPVVRRREFRAALAAGLSTVMEGQASPAEGLKSAADSWKRLVNEIGAERLKNNYRAALGLSTSEKRP